MGAALYVRMFACTQVEELLMSGTALVWLICGVYLLVHRIVMNIMEKQHPELSPVYVRERRDINKEIEEASRERRKACAREFKERQRQEKERQQQEKESNAKK